MLSNCILSMSTTFLPLFLPPLSLPVFLFLPTLYPFPFVYSCPQTGPHLHSLWLTFVFCCVCKSRRWQRICHTHFTIRSILRLGVNASESRLMCLFAQSLCHISLPARWPYFCVISQHCCICQTRDNVAETSLPLPRVDWFAVNEWDQEGEREGIVDHASLDGGGSFKAPVEQKKERGDRKGA